MEKTCFKCGQTKPLALFHKHSGMKDGHLNKCASCVVTAVQEWVRKKESEPGGAAEYRRKRYARSIETGNRTRNRIVKVNGVPVGSDPECHRKSSLRYAHKCKAHGPLDELTIFAMEEAIDLCVLRNAATNNKWSIDHIVPFKHKLACGLHIAANIQVAPANWNYKKSNKNMDRYFGN